MDRLIISDGTTSVTLPRVKKIVVGTEEVSKTVTLAGGKNVKEMIGHRVTVNAEYDYFPADDLTALVALIRHNGFLDVTYPDIDGTDKTASFAVSAPTPTIFKFDASHKPFWHLVTLHMEAQEVI